MTALPSAHIDRPGAHPRWSAWLERQWWLAQPTLAMRLLQPLALVFAELAEIHKASFQWRVQRPYRAPVPVVVVGNVIVGGAGKTPTVIALVTLLKAQGWRPGVISRGYGRRGSGVVAVDRHSDPQTCGDEPLLIHLRAEVPVVVAADRAEAAQRLLSDHRETDLLIADDGLQHWRLVRDIQVLLFDARGAGNGLTLPAGPLRQRLPRSLPPHTLVVYNADRPSTALPGWLARRALKGAVSLGGWWRGDAPSAEALAALRGRPLWAAAGMAQPQRFFDMLQAYGLTLQALPLPDHADFSVLPWPPETVEVLVTEKDAVKLRPDRMGRTQVWVVALDFSLPDEFAVRLLNLLDPLAPPNHVR